MKLRWQYALPLLLALPACEPEGPPRIVGQLASDRLELVAEFAEPLGPRLIAEGDAVAAGSVLVELDRRRIDARLAEARARVAEQRALLDEFLRGPRREQIEATRASVGGAREELAFRRKELVRAEEVYARQLGSPDSVDRARAAVDRAAAELAALEARLEELLAGTTSEELRQAEQRLVQAEAVFAQLELDRERHAIRAPATGVVDSYLYEPGEIPAPGSAVAILLSGEQPHARVYVPEALRVRVQPGTGATVHVDGLSEPLSGRVRWVSSDAVFTPYFALTEHDRGRLAWIAEIDIDADGARLPVGVPVEVELALPADGR